MNKRIKLVSIIFIFIPLFLSSQELDESFLKSLPDDIQKDLQEQNSNKSLNSELNYKPYLYSSKLNQAEELISLKNRLEQDLIELERRLSLDKLWKWMEKYNGLWLEEGKTPNGTTLFLEVKVWSKKQNLLKMMYL